MAGPNKTKIARAVIALHPKSYADALRIDLTKNTPAPLYQWLIASLLFSARISAEIAQNAAKALFEEGWRTPKAMAEVSWAERTKVLNRSGYARYDESTSRYIADTTRLLLDRYDGDLRGLREAAERDPARERDLLKKFKGIGEVGADIFFREAQGAWDELYPFADKRALAAAEKLGLGGDAKTLARLVGRKDLPRLLTALVRVDLGKETDEVLKRAA
jgi:endonuclease III